MKFALKILSAKKFQFRRSYCSNWYLETLDQKLFFWVCQKPQGVRWIPVIYRSSRWQIFFKIFVLKHFAVFTGKHLCYSQTWRSANLLKRDSNTVFSLWLLRNFREHLFLNNCFCIYLFSGLEKDVIFHLRKVRNVSFLVIVNLVFCNKNNITLSYFWKHRDHFSVFLKYHADFVIYISKYIYIYLRKFYLAPWSPKQSNSVN